MMSTNRNIDIARVNKVKTTSPASSSLRPKPKAHSKPQPKAKPASRSKAKIAYLSLIWSSIAAVFRSDIFMLSFLRNLLSMRVLLFAILPLVYFQLRYMLILKPDQILVNLKSFVAPSNTFQFITWLAAGCLLALVSWLADTIIYPALVRIRYQQLDDRKPLTKKALSDSLKGIIPNSLQKLTKSALALVLIAIALAGYYAMYIFGYGDLRLQIWLYVGFSLAVLVVFCIYVSFRFWLQAATAIGSNQGKSKLVISAKQVVLHPGSAIWHGFNWLIGLAIFVAASLAMVWAEIYLLLKVQSVTLNILLLAVFTTALYLLWTIWSSSQIGYWSYIMHFQRHIVKLAFSSEDESGYIGFWIVIIAVLLVFGLFLAICIAYSGDFSALLGSIWTKLPDTIKVNLPRPN